MRDPHVCSLLELHFRRVPTLILETIEVFDQFYMKVGSVKEVGSLMEANTTQAHPFRRRMKGMT
jgi:hypothetical protein